MAGPVTIWSMIIHVPVLKVSRAKVVRQTMRCVFPFRVPLATLVVMILDIMWSAIAQPEWEAIVPPRVLTTLVKMVVPALLIRVPRQLIIVYVPLDFMVPTVPQLIFPNKTLMFISAGCNIWGPTPSITI